MSIFMTICLAMLSIVAFAVLSIMIYAAYLFIRYDATEAKRRLGDFTHNVGDFIKNCFISLADAIDDISLMEMFHHDDDDDDWD